MERVQMSLKAEEGDHFTLLSVFRAWSGAGGGREWCERHFVRWRALRTAQSIYDQLLPDAEDAMRGVALTDTSRPQQPGLKRKELLCRAIASGLFMNAARRCSPDAPVYRSCTVGVDREDHVLLLHIHPDSTGALSSSRAEFVVYQEVVHTAKLFMRNVTAVPAAVLLPLQRAWRYVHPLALSGREPPGAETKHQVQGCVEREPDHSTAVPVAVVAKASTDVQAARERFLKRKR
jgi:HrpA-like RNA helicase